MLIDYQEFCRSMNVQHIGVFPRGHFLFSQRFSEFGDCIFLRKSSVYPESVHIPTILMQLGSLSSEHVWVFLKCFSNSAIKVLKAIRVEKTYIQLHIHGMIDK